MPGKLEITVKFSELPKPLPVQGGIKIGVQTGEGIVTAVLPPKVRRPPDRRLPGLPAGLRPAMQERRRIGRPWLDARRWRLALPAAAKPARALVEAMDGVEIYLARSPEEYGWNESAVGQCPTLLRGFIRSVTRTETMDKRGKPRRQVVVQGNDYGALFASFIAVYWWKYRVAGNSWPDEFSWIQVYGEQFVAKPTADFMRIFLKLANDWLAKIYDQGGWTWRIAEKFSVTEGTNSPMGLSQNQGPTWAVMRMESDSPFNELWVSDEREGPTLHLVGQRGQRIGQGGTWRY